MYRFKSRLLLWARGSSPAFWYALKKSFLFIEHNISKAHESEPYVLRCEVRDYRNNVARTRRFCLLATPMLRPLQVLTSSTIS